MPVARLSPKNLIYHNPVLLQPTLTWLHVQPGGKYVDATYGAGGHAQAIRQAGGLVLGIDQDPETDAQIHANFIHLKEIIQAQNWQPVAGIVLDLGVSGYQFGEARRGFSLQNTGPLDMRMDPALPNTAADLVNQLPVADLASIFRRFGELAGAKTLAEKIVASRPLTTTSQLAKLAGKPDIARQVFQALRIAVNDELGALESVLPQAAEVLMPGGRLVVISFHSLEDRIVKKAFRGWRTGVILTPKPIVGEHQAKLRAWEKI